MTNYTSHIKLKNETSSRVLAQLYHRNSTRGIQSVGWIIDKSTTSSPALDVEFADGSNSDDWFLVLHVVDGDSDAKKTYVSGKGSTIAKPSWQRANLGPADSGETHTFQVTTTELTIVLSSGTTTVAMYPLRDFQSIQQVFVLMLENRSFDNMLAFAGLDAKKATTSNYNIVDGEKYHVQKTAPTSMGKDLGHEFEDVLLQLCGPQAKDPKGGPYPAILDANETCFAASYADTGVATDGMNLSYPLDPASSPSLAYGAQGTGPQLTVALVVAQEEGPSQLYVQRNFAGVFGALGGVAQGTSPSLSTFNDMTNQWVLAYVDADTGCLYLYQTDTSGDPTPLPTDHGVMGETSPSTFGWIRSDTWIVAFQGDQVTLCLYEKYDGYTFTDTKLSMAKGTNPSIAGSTDVGVWMAAFQSDHGQLCLYESDGTLTDTGHAMKSDSSPSIAHTSSGTWLVAFREWQEGGPGTLSVYDSSGSIVRLEYEIEGDSSPSIIALADGRWRVALQSIGRGLVVVDQDGEVLLSGPNMRSGTSPSLVDTYEGGFEVAFQSMDEQACILDQDGASAQTIEIGDVMKCFDTKNQLPVLYELAHAFKVCDQWYSSLPGPTWPNRFFAHCATSGGLDDSPANKKVAESEVDFGAYPMASVFDEIPKQTWSGSHSLHLSYRIYQDCTWPVGKIERHIEGPAEAGAITGAIAGAGGGPVGIVIGASAGAAAGAAAGARAVDPYCYSLYADPNLAKDSLGVRGLGWVPQVLSLEGVSTNDCNSMQSYADDLSAPYDAAYTFIEPHWGNVRGRYQGGSSQHPKDGVYGGENLIKHVYEGLRNSPLWYTSVLIITYDEHGGFFDSQKPPGNATAPGDHYHQKNSHGFTFEQYGARVPAIVISPMIASGVHDGDVYDHSSIPKTLSEVFGIPSLTARDRAAQGVSSLCTKTIAGGDIRKDCPATAGDPVLPDSSSAATQGSAEELSASDQETLPESGNLIGFLHILAKVALELSDGSAQARSEILREFHALETRGDASRFAEKVWRAWTAARRA